MSRGATHTQPPDDPLESMRDLRDGLIKKFPRGTPRHRREIPASRIMRLARKFKSEVGVPVEIKNAVITGNLELPWATFLHGLSITESTFTGEVDLAGAVFEGGLNLSGSRFRGKAVFRAARVRGDCVMTRAKFWQDCSFEDAHFAGSFEASGVRFAKDASFRQTTFDSSAVFRCHPIQRRRGPGAEPAESEKVVPATFGGGLTFARANVVGRLTFEGAQFKGRVDFPRAQLKNTTDFSSDADGPAKRLRSRTRFYKEVDFTACEIGAGAAFLGVEFKGRATFERLRVAGHLLFKPLGTAAGPLNTLFGGEARFLCARVGNNAEFDGAYFVGRANFDRFVVERNIYFRPTFDKECVRYYPVFFDAADFVGAHVKGDAEFTGATFMKEVRLESIHVEGNAFFDDKHAPFPPPVFGVKPVIFMEEVNLVSAHFKHQAKFNGAVFNGGVRLQSADFDGTALFEGAKFAGAADFTGSRFGQLADFRGGTFKGDTDFTSVQIRGAGFFKGAALLGKTSFRAADFKSLDLNLRPPPAGAENFGGDLDLSGFTYELIDINEENERLLGDIFGSMKEYNRQAFTQLEKVLRSIGQDDWADTTYLHRRRKERRQKKGRVAKEVGKIAPRGWRGYHDNAAIRRSLHASAGVLFDLAQSLVGNYGIRPFSRLLAITLAVLFVGTLMFWREGAVVPREADARPPYAAAAAGAGEAIQADTDRPARLSFTQAIGVSFNQFIPIVQIPSGSKWKPSQKLIPLPRGYQFSYFSYAFYGTIHSLLGAILVPLGVAALTGVLHRREKPGR